jgi:hypothetical protein
MVEEAGMDGMEFRRPLRAGKAGAADVPPPPFGMDQVVT